MANQTATKHARSAMKTNTAHSRAGEPIKVAEVSAPEQNSRIHEAVAQRAFEISKLESLVLKRTLALHEAHRRSARNLAHYLALRRHDIRKLQSQLALLGLSSLGRTESHVLNAVKTVHHVLGVLLGSNPSLPAPPGPPVELGEGAQLGESNTDTLLGPPPRDRKVRIMVTMDSE